MEKVFLDTDVVIDLLTDRQPYSEDIAALFTQAEKGMLELHVSSLSFSNIYYIVRKLAGHKKALDLLTRLEKLVVVAPVGQEHIQEALHAGFRDFEDAIQYACARTAGIHTILTRNVKDYAKAACAVHTPDSYLRVVGGDLYPK
jgi:predicted nucleic acid-binding protein